MPSFFSKVCANKYKPCTQRWRKKGVHYCMQMGGEVKISYLDSCHAIRRLSQRLLLETSMNVWVNLCYLKLMTQVIHLSNSSTSRSKYVLLCYLSSYCCFIDWNGAATTSQPNDSASSSSQLQTVESGSHYLFWARVARGFSRRFFWFLQLNNLISYFSTMQKLDCFLGGWYIYIYAGGDVVRVTTTHPVGLNGCDATL